MKPRLIDLFFILIGVAIGIILSLQIQAKPVRLGSFPLDQLEVQKSLLKTFSLEGDDLKKKLSAIKLKLNEAQAIIAKRSSRQTVETLVHLRDMAGLTPVSGNGIQINMIDSPSVTRVDFSSVNEDFVQATDLRDLMNGLFLKEARAVAINGKRVLPLTPIQSVFDSILVDNFQITSPFTIEAIGNPEALKDALQHVKKRKIQMFVDSNVHLTIGSVQNVRSPKFISLSL